MVSSPLPLLFLLLCLHGERGVKSGRVLVWWIRPLLSKGTPKDETSSFSCFFLESLSAPLLSDARTHLVEQLRMCSDKGMNLWKLPRHNSLLVLVRRRLQAHDPHKWSNPVTKVPFDYPVLINGTESPLKATCAFPQPQSSENLNLPCLVKTYRGSGLCRRM